MESSRRELLNACMRHDEWGTNSRHLSPYMLLCLLFCAFVLLIQSSSIFPYTDVPPVCEFFVIVHTAKTGLLRCCLYTPSVTVDRRQQNRINSWKPFVWGFTQRSVDNGLHRSILNLCIHSLSLTFFEFSGRPPGFTPLPPSGGRTRWRLPLLVLPRWHDSRCKRLSVDSAWLKSERFLNGPPGVSRLVERDPPIFVCSEHILVLTFDRWNLVLQDRPIYDKHLHLVHDRAYVYEKHDLAKNDHGFLWIASWCISFPNYGTDSFFSGAFPYLWPWGLPFLITYSWIERRSNVYSMKPLLATVSFKRCPHVQ